MKKEFTQAELDAEVESEIDRFQSDLITKNAIIEHEIMAQVLEYLEIEIRADCNNRKLFDLKRNILGDLMNYNQAQYDTE